jgi:alkylation response protein AidB-like acyl-CoA dehydrogenase
VNAFATTDDQVMLADNLHRMLSDSNEFSRRRSRLSGVNPDRTALWSPFAEQGVIAAAFNESRRGFAGDARTVAVIMAELGAALAVEPYLAAAVIAGRILDRWTDLTASQQSIDAVIAGELICVLAHNAHPDPAAGPPLRIAKASGTIALNGTIRAVRHGDVAHSFLVPVQASDNSIHFYYLNRDQAGMTIDRYRLIDAAGAADLHFNNASVPESARMPLAHSGRDALQDALDWGILGVSAEAAGIIGSLNAATFSYLNTRKQFGSVLAGFQALQHRAVDMWIVSEELQAIMELAIDAMNGGQTEHRAAIMAATKVMADGAGRKVGNESVQLHGGMGVSDELIVSHYFRRLAAIRGEWGSEDTHRLRIRSVQ